VAHLALILRDSCDVPARALLGDEEIYVLGARLSFADARMLTHSPNVLRQVRPSRVALFDSRSRLGRGLITLDALPIVAVVDVPRLLRQDVQASVTAHRSAPALLCV